MTFVPNGDTTNYNDGSPTPATALVVVPVNADGSAGGLLVKANPYPNLSTPLINASANQANAAAAATLTGTATTTVYMSGFEVTGSGATVGLPVAVTVAGILGGTRTYIYTFATGALLGNTPLIVPFTPPLPAAAVNTPIVVTCPASGAGGLNNTVVAHGYYQ